MTKDVKLARFYELGYRFKIETKRDEKLVRIEAPPKMKEYKTVHRYQKDVSERKIMLDLIDKILLYLRLRPVEKLESY